MRLRNDSEDQLSKRDIGRPFKTFDYFLEEIASRKENDGPWQAKRPFERRLPFNEVLDVQGKFDYGAPVPLEGVSDVPPYSFDLEVWVSTDIAMRARYITHGA